VDRRAGRGRVARLTVLVTGVALALLACSSQERDELRAALGGATASTTTAVVGPTPAPVGTVPERLGVEVLARFPHDTGAFTQGLEVADGVLYESTGMYGESDLRTVDVTSGEPIALSPNDRGVFAEGLTVIDDQLVQLTWRENTAYVWDRAALTEVGRFEYEGEGWGICDDGTRLVMSDGSARLTFRDRTTFEATGTVDVTREGELVGLLNELECVGGDVYANVWQTTDIVRIDPASGAVTAVIDASGIAAEVGAGGLAVLNGIAHVEADRFYVTGKYWPTLFEVRFVPAG
jgi:glutaminyl-peptide cyclotransferase